MKTFKFLILTVLCFLVIGCTNPNENEHTHSFTEGRCECGEIDPQHQHKFVDGLCSCGEKEPLSKEEVAIQNAIKTIVIPRETTDNFYVPRRHTEGDCEVIISWSSSDLTVVNNYGYIKRKNFVQNAEMTATLECGKYEVEVSYPVTVLPFTEQERLEMEMSKISVESVLTDTTQLPTECSDSEIDILWNFSHPEIFDNKGTCSYPNNVTEMTLTLTLKLNQEEITKEFIMIAYKEATIEKFNTQNIIDSNEAFDNGVLINLEKNENNKLVLKNECETGTYLSPVIETSHFDTLVGSWSAITNQQTGSLEVFFRVLVDGVWSDYFTYGEWRLGDQNRGVSKKSSNGIAEMEEDTVFILNDKTASAYQYMVEFNRLDENNQSPELLLVACCIKVIGYEEVKLDYTKIKQEVVYDVPQLNQNIVPVIGNSICSPTSTTMLLKYYGHSFEHDDYAFEHQYVAMLAKDYGHNMFGNWVYNVAVMGAYGEFAYVKRFINNDELMWHLENVGPVALSVKGNMQGYYNTGGHLLVCKGYKIVDGEVIFICNDPNIKNVEVEYTYETIENVWREIAYVIETNK